MRRDDDVNRGNNVTRPNNSRRNRALSLTPDEFEQVNNDYKDCLTLSSDEINQISSNYQDNIMLTSQDMSQIRDEYNNPDTSVMQDMDALDIPNTTGTSAQLIHEYLKGVIGRFIIVDFLIGTQSMIKKQGYLFDIGSNWILLFDDILKNFVMCDLYAIKFITSPYRKPTTSVNNNPQYQLQATPISPPQQQTTASPRRRR